MSNRSFTERNIQNPSRNGREYPNPFFDLASSYIPKDIKVLFKYCKGFFYTNAFLRNVITKLTEYPITDLLYKTDVDEKIREKWDELLHEQLKIKSFLIEIGLDYFTYGNSFISYFVKQKRFLKCTKCGHEDDIKNISFKLKNFEFYGSCKECKASEMKFTVHEEALVSRKHFRLLRWSPQNIDIEYNPITGSSLYYYNIPNKIKKQIISGNAAILRDIPLVFLEALKTKKRIELDESNLYHFKRPTLAEEDMGWGKPIILPALKDIFYLQTLRRGNEAIAMEHIVPKKSIYPANTVTLDPYSQLNLAQWRTEMEEQIKKWREDVNHIGVFPIPIGYQELGGNARALLLTPEMKFLEENIINSLGVPIEFIKGGASWTGSSISLRIIENHFLTYRELLEDFVNHFLLPNASRLIKLPPIKLKFKKFKMSDDVQEKQLMLEMNGASQLSTPTLLEEWGYHYADEMKLTKKHLVSTFEMQGLQKEMDAESSGKAQVILAKYQARSEKAMQDEMLKMKMELFQKELEQEFGGIPEDAFSIIDQYAIQIMALEPAMQQQTLMSLKTKTPTIAVMVMERINQYQLMMESEAPAAPPMKSKSAPNEQQPGTRQKDKPNTPSSDKSKAQTRGSA